MLPSVQGPQGHRGYWPSGHLGPNMPAEGAAPSAGAHPVSEGLGEPSALGSWGGQSEGLVRGGGCGTGHGGPCRPSKDCGSWKEVEALSGPAGEHGFSTDHLLGRDSGAGMTSQEDVQGWGVERGGGTWTHVEVETAGLHEGLGGVGGRKGWGTAQGVGL